MKRWMVNSAITAVILAWMLWPVACVAVALGMASYAGAQVDEGGVHPCVIHGVDYGETVNVLFVMGWFGMYTLPTGALALLVFAIIATIEYVFALRRRRRAALHPA